MAGEGLVSMTPSSVTHTGTSASINADGGIDFSAVTALGINDVFNSNYTNYRVLIRLNQSAYFDMKMLLTVGGVGSTTGYTRQYLIGNGASLTAARSGYSFVTVSVGDSGNNGVEMHLYGPALAESTAMRINCASANGGAYFDYEAFTHSVSTAYDGFSLSCDPGQDLTGNLHVFGYEE